MHSVAVAMLMWGTLGQQWEQHQRQLQHLQHLRLRPSSSHPPDRRRKILAASPQLHCTLEAFS